MSNNIYVVVSHTGEWSDHQEIMVCAFKSEAAAQNKVLELTQQEKVDAILRKDLEDYSESLNSSNPMKDVDYPDVNWERYHSDTIYKADRDAARKVFDDVYEPWCKQCDEMVEARRNELAKTVDINSFDERKDRHYDYAYYTYQEVELHDQ